MGNVIIYSDTMCDMSWSILSEYFTCNISHLMSWFKLLISVGGAISTITEEP